MNYFLRHSFASILFGGLLVSAQMQAQAQEFRIGFVSNDRIFREASTAKSAQLKLEQEFSKREKEIVDLRTALKTLADTFEREAPTLPPGKLASRQKQLVEQDRDFQRKSREFQEDLNARKNEELQQLIERANKVVKQVAEAEKYDLILQDAVYVNPRLDITDKVLKVLNSNGVK